MPLPATPIQPGALPDAMLLATTGGLLDAVVYLNYGHVFANTMTGNVIFLGIAFLGHTGVTSSPTSSLLPPSSLESPPPNTCAPA